MYEEYAKLITGLPLFKGYTEDGAQRLIRSGEVKDHAPGEALMREGDPAMDVLLVLTGKLEVFVEREGHDLILTDRGPGSVLGELAVLCGIPRAASVRVIDPSTVLHWEGTAFRRLLLADAFLSQRIFQEALRTLIEKERSLIDSLIKERQS